MQPLLRGWQTASMGCRCGWGRRGFRWCRPTCSKNPSLCLRRQVRGDVYVRAQVRVRARARACARACVRARVRVCAGGCAYAYACAGMYRGGGRRRFRAIISPGKISEGEKFATQSQSLHCLPHTLHCQSPQTSPQNISPSSLKTKFSHEIIPPPPPCVQMHTHVGQIHVQVLVRCACLCVCPGAWAAPS